MTTLHEGGRKHYNLVWMSTVLAVCDSTVGIAGQCFCVAVWPMCCSGVMWRRWREMVVALGPLPGQLGTIQYSPITD